MSTLIKEFESLSKRTVKAGNIPVTQIPKFRKHKLGINENGTPVFFIHCTDTSGQRPVDSNLDLISIEFNKQCELRTTDNKRIQGTYTIISLKTDSLEITRYFLEIILLMLLNLPDKITMVDLRKELAKIVTLFSKLTEPAIKSLQGLWAELLVIERSSNPQYLIESWHISATDTFDFNDGADKIEVKSTSRNRRVHTFSIEQLNPNSNSSLLIASVLVIQSGLGKNITQLIGLIEKKVSSPYSLFLLKEKVALCLGKDIDNTQDVYFDYSHSADSLSFYKSESIPKIDSKAIPLEISNIHFNCDISKVKPCNKKDVKGKLLKQAF